jgi:hypothetical protein
MSSDVNSVLERCGSMMMWVIVVILVIGASCEDTETVRTLKEQVSALLEDFSLLAKNSELTALREELTALRYMEHNVQLLKGPREFHVSGALTHNAEGGSIF